MARIRKHRNKWQVLYRDPATNRERSAGVFRRKSDARSISEDIETRMERGTFIDPDLLKTPYKEWVGRWLGTRTDLKPKTIAGYESLLQSRILPTFADHRIGWLRTIDIEEWVSVMTTEGLSASRIRQAYFLVSASLKAAVRSGYIPSNPATGVKLPKIEQREMKFLESPQVLALADEVGDHYRALVFVLGFCGIRIGEALALRRSSINLMRSELRVTESLADVNGRMVFGSTKTRQARTVVLPDAVRAELERHLETFAAPAADSLVFTSYRGDPIRLQNFRRRVWEPAVLRAGLPAGLRIHDLRHTAASILVNAGVPMKSVQEHLGHSSITVTMDRYAHLNAKSRRHVLDVLNHEIASVPQAFSPSDADLTRTNRA